MSMQDPLGDMLTRIRNGQAARKPSVKAPNSRLKRSVLDVLQSEGYIRGYQVEEVRAGVSELNIELKYYSGEPVIRELQRVSTPGRRSFSKIGDLRSVRNGLGIYVMSTPRGVMSDAAAREANVGGEVLCQVF